MDGDGRAWLTGHFLIAMPQLADPNFFHTVTFICEHNEEGALGLVVNRPSEMRLGEILEHMGIEGAEAAAREVPVYVGGPVQRERGFVLHEPAGAWASTLRVGERVGITTSRDILEAIARGAGPERYLVALGYAGWGPGQLEQEMADNAWLSGPADMRIVFEVPDEAKWEAAARHLGIDLGRLSGEAGHA